MRRALLILFTLMSCLVLVVSGSLWMRSYRVATGWAWDDPSGRRRELVSYAGAVHVRELTGAGFGASPGVRMAIREDVPQGADWQTRCGGGMSIVWQRAGFAIASGTTPMVFLTSWVSPVQQVKGVMTTSYIQNVAPQPVVVSGMTVNSADALILDLSGGGLKASGNVTITGGGVPAAALTGQNIVFSPNYSNTWQ